MDAMQKKILVNVWEPLIESLNAKTDKACLRRDTYLDAVLSHEASKLNAEVAGQNSDAAKAYLLGELQTLQRKPLNLLLSSETVDLINEACQNKNTPRDAFINRVLLLLLIGTPQIKKLFPDIDWEWCRRRIFDQGDDWMYRVYDHSMLGVMTDIARGDPFWYLRACIDAVREDGGEVPLVHEMFIPKHALNHVSSAIGFNCYIDDSDVEGTESNLERKRLAAEFLDQL